MTTARSISKTFAENLGASVGGCVRDLTVTLFDYDAARKSGVRLNPIPFMGNQKKLGFKIRYAALIAALGLFTARREVAHIKADEKLLHRMESAVVRYSDTLIKLQILDKVSDEERELHKKFRLRLFRTALERGAGIEHLARAFLEEINRWEGRSEAVDAETLARFTEYLKRPEDMFVRIVGALTKSEWAYERQEKPQA